MIIAAVCAAALENHTPLAKRYSHPLLGHTTVLGPKGMKNYPVAPLRLITTAPNPDSSLPRIAKTTLKSGITPITPTDEGRDKVFIGGAALKRKRDKRVIEAMQRVTQTGFSSRILVAMEALPALFDGGGVGGVDGGVGVV